MTRKPSVILIREWEQQMSGSGCCGRLDGEFLGCDNGPVFAERRAVMEAMAPVYRMVRNQFADTVDLLVVDPRNLPSLVFILIRDFWTFQVGIGDALKTLGRISVQTVIVNGRVVARGRWPDPVDVAEMLEEVIADGTSRRPITVAR